jgi:hypothetical protein
MRTTLDLPDPLLRQLKSRAALEGTTLKQLVRETIERGLDVQPESPAKARGRSALPCVEIGRPLRLRRLSNAAVCALANE